MSVVKAYEVAKEKYAKYGVNTDEVLKKMQSIVISMHCWQGDDVGGFEMDESGTGGGIMATGNYPGVARTPEELRADFAKAMSLVPGKHSASIHAKYLECNGKRVDRDEITPEHFAGWKEWAADLGIGLDFNSTLFAHKNAASGLTLSNPDAGIRNFWIEHCKRAREISADFGKSLGKVSVDNLWIPDGFKENPASKIKYRELLMDSLNQIFEIKHSPLYTKDALESKLFGIGSESYVVGSHEFYYGYALKNDLMVTYDMGHFHQTESIADKISATLLYFDNILLHVSRGVRWDSDHVVILNDELTTLMQEIKRCDAFDRIYMGLDFFDASINRLSAWVIGARSTLKAALMALLEPTALIEKAENEGDFGTRLGLLEEFKALPWADVWDMYCEMNGVPTGSDWMDAVKNYEKDVLAKR